jgi:NAD(P)-dependent dehydrogenase (short-subunit alcohol dehydrogenase family)
VAWCHPFALGLAQAGAAVAILARNEEKNQRILEELQALGVPTLAMRVDVTARGQLQPALEKVEETLGPVNILINNASIVNSGGILEQTPEDWDQVIETNLNACFLLSKACGSIDGEAAPRKNHQQRQHICPLWRRIRSSLQRLEGGFGPADQIDDDRVGPV